MKFLAVLTAVLLVCSLGVPYGLAGPATADGLAQVTMRPSASVVAPGQTFTVDVVLTSTPQLASGAVKAGLELEYDTRYLEVVSVERGPFMGMGRPTTVVETASEFDNEAGTITLEYERDPWNDGASGTERYATVTFHVKDDAPTTGRLAFEPTMFVLLTDGMYQFVQMSPTSVTVDPDAPDPADQADPADEGANAPPADGAASGPLSGEAMGAVAALGSIGALFVVLFVWMRRV